MSLTAAGFLSDRQWVALDQRISDAGESRQISVAYYYSALRYLARVSQWSQRSLEFQFGNTLEHWSALTDHAVHLIPDRLRGSPLLAYTRALDVLMQDADQQVGVKQNLFDEECGGGLRALNPGLRRGTLLDIAAARRGLPQRRHLSVAVDDAGTAADGRHSHPR